MLGWYLCPWISVCTCCYLTCGYDPSKSNVLGLPVCVTHLCWLLSPPGSRERRFLKGGLSVHGNGDHVRHLYPCDHFLHVGSRTHIPLGADMVREVTNTCVLSEGTSRVDLKAARWRKMDRRIEMGTAKTNGTALQGQIGELEWNGGGVLESEVWGEVRSHPREGKASGATPGRGEWKREKRSKSIRLPPSCRFTQETGNALRIW